VLGGLRGTINRVSGGIADADVRTQNDASQLRVRGAVSALGNDAGFFAGINRRTNDLTAGADAGSGDTGVQARAGLTGAGRPSFTLGGATRAQRTAASLGLRSGSGK
jgi:hypothetical protein